MLGIKTNQKCECGSNLYKSDNTIYCPRCGNSNDNEFSNFTKGLNRYVALKAAQREADMKFEKQNKTFVIASLCFAAFWIGMLVLWMVMS